MSNFEEERIAQQIEGLEREISTLDEQISMQKTLIGLAERDLAQARAIAAGGFISQREIGRRRRLCY